MRRTAAALVAVALAVAGGAVPANAAQDDAGSGGDAGDTFAAATAVKPFGAYTGRLAAGSNDRDDFYRFHLDEGTSMSVLVTLGATPVDPIELLDPNGVVIDSASRVSTVSSSSSQAFTHAFGELRLAVHRALVPGDYRLHLRTDRFPMTKYDLCFMNCEEPRHDPIQTIFGGSLRHPDTKVLVIPPLHGDLGDPFGPTVLDYVEATVRGIRRWSYTLDVFSTMYPSYDYLREIDIDVEVFDGVLPIDHAGYDVIIGYVAAGPAFRGVATSLVSLQPQLDAMGLDMARFSGRFIALSLFGSSPRAGQVAWDFPALDDLEIVTMHEFGHTFGLGHTRTWDRDLGPDLMNSPAPFVYGNGSPVGDGGERTGDKCLTTLDVYGMAKLYEWIPSGQWKAPPEWIDLPASIPYAWIC